MSRKSRPFIPGPGTSVASGQGPSAEAQVPGKLTRGIDRALAIQRPVVLAHLRSIRKRHPDADPAALAKILERRYVAAVTTGGAAVGATAVVPGIGTGLTLALSGVETAGFLEATALYAQSLSEIHGLSIDDPERARALVLTMMLGREGSDLVRQLAREVIGTAPGRSSYWGQLVTSTLPTAVVGRLVTRLKTAFLHHFMVRGGASIVGRALPFGVGAVVGGVGNNIVGRRVLRNSRSAFGPVPGTFPSSLQQTIRL